MPALQASARRDTGRQNGRKSSLLQSVGNYKTNSTTISNLFTSLNVIFYILKY